MPWMPRPPRPVPLESEDGNGLSDVRGDTREGLEREQLKHPGRFPPLTVALGAIAGEPTVVGERVEAREFFGPTILFDYSGFGESKRPSSAPATLRRKWKSR